MKPFDQEYADDVARRLTVWSKIPAVILFTDRTLSILWEPGDATRYEAYAMQVPGRPGVLAVSGSMGYEGGWFLEVREGVFVSRGYFAEKNPGIQNQHTQMQLSRIIAAAVHGLADDYPNLY